MYYDPETITDSPDRDYGSTRGYSNESEFTVVKVLYRYISLVISFANLMLYNSRLISITISKPTSLNSTTQTSDRSKTSYSKLRSMASSTWLSKLQKFSDLVSNQPPSRYNIDNVGTEGGLPGIQPAFGSGQDSFLASLATKGTTSLIPHLPTTTPH